MDLSQRKLTKREWEGMEVPVKEAEMGILHMIVSGYNDPNTHMNQNQALFSYLKTPMSDGIHEYLYKRFLDPSVRAMYKKYDNLDISSVSNIKTTYKPNSKDIIRIDRSAENLDNTKQAVFEFVLIDNLKKLIRYEKNSEESKVARTWYSMVRILKNKILHVNPVLSKMVHANLSRIEDGVSVRYLLRSAAKIMERNELVIDCRDEALYDHQKQVYNIFRQRGGNAENPNDVTHDNTAATTTTTSNLVQYLAPTATGKTMTPLGLSSAYRIIYVCAARHVGLALARSAISMSKKIAFAFGATCAEDIRLHYGAAKEFTRDWNTGGIRKVDNTVGDDVEIMICDLKSYLPAMFYMLAFNSPQRMIMFWDEPTISLDYSDHPCHETISQNWQKNVIPNVVLSSATLPDEAAIRPVIDNFNARFPNPRIHMVRSHDCRKTIPLIDRQGRVAVPHTMFPDIVDLRSSTERCLSDITTFRHLELNSCVTFIGAVHDMTDDPLEISVGRKNHRYHMDRWFGDAGDITGNDIKSYYLKLLLLLNPSSWSVIRPHVSENCVPMYRSVTNVSTDDAHTLTDGPTIYLADDIEKIGKFCIHKSKIPSMVMERMMESIAHNNRVNEKLAAVERDLEDKLEAATASKDGAASAADKYNKSGGKNKSVKDTKVANERVDDETKKLIRLVKDLEKLVKVVELDDVYVPNTKSHIARWAKDEETAQSFACDVSADVVERIMLINDVADIWKLLLLCGIGVFTEHTNIKYTELMKELADDKRLFMIIGSSDFIYGTNYQFSHGYIGADLSDMTQQKITQTIGRVGRATAVSDYSVRFRNDVLIKRFFACDTNMIEATNMNRLFCEPTKTQESDPLPPPGPRIGDLPRPVTEPMR